MVSQQPWLFQQDAYGVATCIYMMMHNTPLEIVQKNGKTMPKQGIPAGWQADLWNYMFESLLNISPNASGVPYAEMKERIESHFKHNLNDAKSLKLQLCQQNIMLSEENL